MNDILNEEQRREFVGMMPKPAQELLRSVPEQASEIALDQILMHISGATGMKGEALLKVMEAGWKQMGITKESPADAILRQALGGGGG